MTSLRLFGSAPKARHLARVSLINTRPSHHHHQLRMSSSTQTMHLLPDNTGLWGITQTPSAAAKTSELLQQDMENHHVFFNQSGFHNHIPHHLLALYGTGAGPSHLQSAYDTNASYQRPVLPVHKSVTLTPETLTEYYGKEEYYPDFLTFFQSEIDRLGWKETVTRYLFEEGEGKEDLIIRLFGGFLHPLIQLMYGLEWGLTGVVAEGLAQAAVHRDDLREFLLTAEEKGRGREEGETVLGLLREAEGLKGAARSEDGNKIRDGVLVRAKGEMVDLAGRVKVGEGEVEGRTREMFNGAVYVAAGAAVSMTDRKKVPKFDFFLMHHVNAAPFFVTMNKMDWVPEKTKRRLLEWKIRMDLLQYVARGCPELRVERLEGYEPKQPGKAKMVEEIVSRLHGFGDDGHAIKLGRATVVCRNICREYEEKEGFMIKGGLWEKICHLIVDSVEAPGEHWVRSAGFEEAWKDIPNVDDSKL
ncbi:hypothetical protein QC762_211830 [Podospora pseudocomata]|uniref:Uncharacterized protein n=1 Tax=Podospora pseudocomata TaxID=2093779 RepID=A0ABR0GNJ8_9PEZI|nr:hypothetical protein QC762_211830 [Podospora pseudocomata]